MSARLAFSRKFQTAFVRLLPEQTKVVTWISKGLLLCFLLWNPSAWVVLVLCGAESLWETPQTPQSTVLGGLVGLWWIRGGLGLSWCWTRPRELPGRWERGERRAEWGRRGAQMIVPVVVKFDLRGWCLILWVFLGRKECIWRRGCWNDVDDVLLVNGVLTGVYDCGCNWASDWSWGWSCD